MSANPLPESPDGAQSRLILPFPLLFPAICALGLAVLTLARVISADAPLGSAGLYALMAESIAQNGFALPAHIPFYGPGGIPFAYPPLALYVLAALAQIPGTDVLTWERYLPVVFCALSLFPVYGLYRELLPKEWMARAATVLFAAAPAWLALDLWADGSVRSFAFFWGMLALYAGRRALARPSVLTVILAGASLGLALASHLEVANFVVITLAVLTVACPPLRRRALAAAAIAAVGIVVASPWWGTVLLREGVQPFLSSMQSHGGVGGISFTSGPEWLYRIVAVLVQYVPIGGLSLPVYVVALLGLARCLRERSWTLPLWTLALCILLPEGQRFIAVPVAGAAAIPLWEIARAAVPAAARWSSRKRTLAGLAGLCLVALYASWHLLLWEFSVTPNLTGGQVAAGHWLELHAPRDARVLALSDVQDQPEWLPYLDRRTPLIGHWGAEWNGEYAYQSALVGGAQDCIGQQSLPCLTDLLRSHHLRPDYVVLLHRQRLPRLQQQIENRSGWQRDFTHEDAIIWQTRPGADGALPGS